MLIQNLSKTGNPDKIFGFNQVGLFTFLSGSREVWDAMCVCSKNQAIHGVSLLAHFPPETENLLRSSFHTARLEETVSDSKAEKGNRMSINIREA